MHASHQLRIRKHLTPLMPDLGFHTYAWQTNGQSRPLLQLRVQWHSVRGREQQSNHGQNNRLRASGAVRTQHDPRSAHIFSFFLEQALYNRNASFSTRLQVARAAGISRHTHGPPFCRPCLSASPSQLSLSSLFRLENHKLLSISTQVLQNHNVSENRDAQKKETKTTSGDHMASLN